MLITIIFQFFILPLFQSSLFRHLAMQNTSDLRSQSHIQVTRKTLDGMSTRSALHWDWALKVLGHLLIYGHLGNWALRN